MTHVSISTSVSASVPDRAQLAGVWYLKWCVRFFDRLHGKVVKRGEGTWTSLRSQRTSPLQPSTVCNGILLDYDSNIQSFDFAVPHRASSCDNYHQLNGRGSVGEYRGSSPSRTRNLCSFIYITIALVIITEYTHALVGDSRQIILKLLSSTKPPPSSSLWWHTIFFVHWFPNWFGNASVALVQKVQTPSPAPTPQDRHPSRAFTDTHAREFSNPRIPLLSRHDERWAKPRPWPWLTHHYGRRGIVVTRGRTTTRAALLLGLLLLLLLLLLSHRGEASEGTMGRAFPFRFGRQSGSSWGE